MKYSSEKDINKLIQQLIRKGWHYKKGKKHGKLLSPSDDKTLSEPCSPSDSRAFINFKHDVLRIRDKQLVG